MVKLDQIVRLISSPGPMTMMHNGESLSKEMFSTADSESEYSSLQVGVYSTFAIHPIGLLSGWLIYTQSMVPD